MFSNTSGKAEGVSTPSWIYKHNFSLQKSEERGHIPVMESALLDECISLL